MELPKTQPELTTGSLAPTERLDLSDTCSDVSRAQAPDHDATAELRAGDTLESGRFQILRTLGEGGMGRVYAAYDEAYGCEVALKTLRARHAELLFGLKNEFRSLAFVTHPHLVELYELICDGELWFMTMELVDGENLAVWLQQHERERERGNADHERALCDLFRSIALGIDALHAARKLHRDLKPSNIMRAHDGRVVILDFGLVADAHRSAGSDEPGVVAGTPVYLAPEQTLGIAASPASDWYAFGVMLYEALSGTLPFSGEVLGVLDAKRSRDAPPLSAAPYPRLCRLAEALLARDPARRPPAQAILDVFGASVPSESEAPLRALTTQPPEPGLLGRDRELAQLRAAFVDAAAGQVVGVWVHGPSGIGKSTLLHHLLSELESQHHALVLRGRCYERESVPYKACDAMIDGLSRQLASFSLARLPEVLPESPRALLRLFPMLGRVPWLTAPAANDHDLPTDQRELRRDAFHALRQLLHQLAAHAPLVLYIDDLQWGDADSAKLLAALLAPPAPPAGLLFLGSFRTDERTSGELLPALAGDLELAGSFAPRELELGPLTAADAVRLAELVLGDRQALAGEIARETEGNPFFIGELARHLALGTRGVTLLSHAIEQRVALLPAPARALLDVVAVSGRPIESHIALSSSELRATDRRVLARLETAHLLRARRTERGELVETYHDRVRHAVVRALAKPELRRVHARVAHTLESNGVLDPERLAVHFREAGEPLKAAEYAERAGDAAYRALAFERAASWYGLALDPPVFDLRRQQLLRARLGDALTYAGRGAQAAQQFLLAARDSGRHEAVELERRAAEQLLISGRRSEGLATLTKVLRRSGIAGPERGPALLRLLWQRARLRLRGTEFAPRPAGSISPRILRRIDACGVAARTLVVREPVKGAIFGSLHLRLALDAGEPTRVVEGLATEIMYTATEGLRGQPRVQRLIARARGIADAYDEPAAQAYLTTAVAADALLNGRFAEAATAAASADKLFRERCTGVTGPLNLARCIWTPAVLFTGDIPAALEPLGEWLESARERADLEAHWQLGIYRLYGPLAAGDLDSVRGALTGMLERWRPGQLETAGMTAVHVLVGLECYARAAPPALAAVRKLYQPFFRSLLARVQLYRIVVTGYCANLELAMGHASKARALADRLANEHVRHADALAALARAGAARLEGDLDGAVGQLRHSIAAFEADRQQLWAACARLRLGRLLGGDEGRELAALAHEQMRARAVAEPDRFVAVYAPGHPD